MSLVSQAITNLQNGVSQQTAALRFSNQCEEQLNCRNDPVDGMGKRYNSTLKGQLVALPDPELWHTDTIERDDFEKYKFYVRSGEVRVFNAESGVEYPVTTPPQELIDYLTIQGDADSNRAFLLLNTIDTTFVLNRTVPVKRVISSVTPRQPEAIWYIKQADYATDYKVKLNGTTMTITTPEATSTRARSGLDTTGLAVQMRNEINDKKTTHGCVATAYGNVLYIVADDGSSDFSISASDDLGDRASYAIKGWLNDFNDLPPNAKSGFRVEIRGDAGDTDVEPYHVVYSETDDDGKKTAGVWKETLKHGADYRLDTTTMPLSIQRTQDAGNITGENPLGITFTLAETGFLERTVGDDITAPFPSFCSIQDESTGAVLSPRHIQTMVYHKNRLCFVADENLIFSETGDYMNSFPTTVVTELDSDPIDVALNLNDVAPIEHVVVNAGTMFLFAPEVQLKVQSGEIFNAASLDVTVASRYEMDTGARPFVHGSVIHFWGKGSKYSTLYEYIPQGDTERYVALEVTSHVPRYVEGQVVKTVSSHSENILFHLTRLEDGGAPFHLYVTNLLMNGDERVQNAWQKWTFNGSVVDAHVDQDVLSLVIEHNDGVFIEEIIISHDPLKNELGYPVYLDRREEVDASFIVPVDDHRVLFNRDGRYFVGFPYQQKYVFSEFFMRSDGKPIVGGRLQLRYLTLAFNNTTEYTVNVSRGGVDSRSKRYDGRVLDDVLNILNSIPVVHGTARFPIHTKSENAVITITNDTPHDAVFQTAEWEGTYTRRSRRT